MNIDLIPDIDPKELQAPAFYPIEYAILWIASGQKPINPEYAKIFYGKPSVDNKSPKLEIAKRRLISLLRSGSISSKTMQYVKSEGKYVASGEYIDLPKECWGGTFSWRDYSLSHKNSDGVYWEYTHILLNTEELVRCSPLDEMESAKKAQKNTGKIRDLLPKEKESLLKLVLGLVLTNYEYNPNASRNSTSREIVSDLNLHGLSIDEDTVRKWLNEAKELLPVSDNT